LSLLYIIIFPSILSPNIFALNVNECRQTNVKNLNVDNLNPIDMWKLRDVFSLKSLNNGKKRDKGREGRRESLSHIMIWYSEPTRGSIVS
jgi:hypothetical protein